MTGRADIAWSRQLARTSPGQVAQWAMAALVVLTAHAGAGWWAMRERPIQAADDAPPAAIMIDLAPMAMAPEAIEEQIAEDEIDQVAMDAPPTPEPAEAVDITEAAEPVETAESVEPVEEEPETVEAEPEVLEPIAEVPEPVVRPKPSRPPQVQKKKPPKPKPPTPSRQKTKAQVQAPEAPRYAAPQTSSGVAAISPARWESRLLAHLERRKRYPASARQQRQQGTAQVRFSIDTGGNVLSVSLVRSSGVAALDQEVVAMVRRASPVPAPPPSVSRTITVPVRFTLR